MRFGTWHMATKQAVIPTYVPYSEDLNLERAAHSNVPPTLQVRTSFIFCGGESRRKDRYSWLLTVRTKIFLISNFRRVLKVARFLLGNSAASEFYMPTFQNTLFHLHRRVGTKFFVPTRLWRWNSVPKRRHIKVRRRGITQKKTYNRTKIFWTACVSH
jgi:hypothetical protein